MAQEAFSQSPQKGLNANSLEAGGSGESLLAAAREQAIRAGVPVLAGGLAVANLIAIREIFVILRGDELLTIVSLGTAVLALGVGAFLPIGFVGVGKAREATFIFFYWLAAIAAPAGVICVRVFHNEVLGAGAFHTPMEAVIVAGIIAAPMNIAAGCAMALAFPRTVTPDKARGSEYALFMLGLAAGCGAFTYLLSGDVAPLLVDLCITILLLTTAAIVSWRLASAALVMSPVIWISLLVAITVACSPLCQMLNFFCEKRLFSPSVVETHTGPAGVVTVWKQDRNVLIGLNGVGVVRRGGTRGQGQVVEAAHIPILLHPEPQRVMLLGGSDPQMVDEILREPVESVHHYMPDEGVEMAFLSAIGYSSNQPVESGRLQAEHVEGDARGVFKGLKGSYDVILVDLPPQVNAFMNRFYTAEFFSDLKALLKRRGIVGIRVTRPDGVLSARQILALSSLMGTFGSVFPNYIVAGSETTLLIGSVDAQPLPLNPGVLEQRRAERGLQVSLPGIVKSDIPLLRQRATGGGGEMVNAPINQELRPITSLLSAVGWLAMMPPGLRARAAPLLMLGLETLGIILAAICLCALIAAIISKRGAAVSAPFGLIAGGFVAGVLMGVLLMADQFIYGTLFRDIAILGTAFFLGATSVGVIALARRVRPSHGNVFLAGLLLLLGGVAIVTPIVLQRVANESDASLRILHLFITLPLLSALAGCAGGGLIPAAAFAGGGRSDAEGVEAGHAWRIDRFAFALGPVAGALGLMFGAVLLVPVLGIFESCYFCALAASMGVVVLILGGGR